MRPATLVQSPTGCEVSLGVFTSEEASNRLNDALKKVEAPTSATIVFLSATSQNKGLSPTL
jgi:hypothetical protein